MDRLVDDAASFRSAAIPADELWKVLVDPTEPAQFRAGAALALRRNLDEEGRARVRIAANASAEPPLKRVLAAVNEEDDAALDAALDALAPDEPRRWERVTREPGAS